MKEFTALIYEQWRSARLLFFVAAWVSVIGFVFALQQMVFDSQIHFRGERAGDAVGWSIVGQCMWIAFVLLGSGNNDDLRVTVPRYLTKLPVSAWKLVAARLSFGILSQITLILIFVAFYFPMFNSSMEADFRLKVAFFIIPAYIVLQAIFWAVGPLGYIPTFTTSIFATVVFIRSAEMLLFFPTLIWITPLLLISIVLSIFAVSRHRLVSYSGLTDPIALPRSRRRKTSTLPDTFASEKEALQWYEYRRHWQLYPRILLICFVALVLIILGTTDFDEIFGAGIGGLAFFVFIALFNGTLLTFCIFLFRSKRYLTSRDSAFVYVRPVSTLDLAASQWRASADAMLVGWLPAAAVALFILVDGLIKAESGADQLQPFMNIVIILFYGMTMWASLWPAVSVGAFGVMMTALLLNMGRSTALDLSVTDYILFSFPAASVIAGGLLAVLFIWNWRNILLNAKHVLITLTLIALAIFGHQLLQEYNPGDYSWVPFWAFMLIAPILTTPAIIHRTRHRR